MSRKALCLITTLGLGAAWAARQYRNTTRAQDWRQRMGAVEPRTALVTGASSGIGAVFARALAAQGYDLLLVARREAPLAAMADELHRLHGVQVNVLTADLSTQDGIDRVAACIEQLPALDVLVNNAGYNTSGRFAQVPIEDTEALIRCLTLACVRLARVALPGMLARRRGAIINVASTSGFVPLPRSATYSAAKSYLIRFSQALALETAGTGVRVQALCPGFTRTAFHDGPAYNRVNFKQRLPAWLWMDSEDVVAAALQGLVEDRVVVIPGLVNQATVWLANLGLAGLQLEILQCFFAKGGEGPLA